MATAQLIRVLLVDDHTMVRQGLRSVLESYPNIDVVGQAGDGESAIEMVAKLQPAVVLMDINLPKMDGITSTRFIKTSYPNIAVVGFSMTVHSYSEYAMLKAGAFEVLPKDKAVHELYAAIQRAVASIQPVVILKDSKLDENEVFGAAFLFVSTAVTHLNRARQHIESTKPRSMSLEHH
jgi:DNA-binding NarL/FixJ family response regulator